MNFLITSGDGVAPLLASISLVSAGSFSSAVKQALSTFKPFASSWEIIRSIVACGTVAPDGIESKGTVVVSSGKMNPETGGAESEAAGGETDLLSPQADSRPTTAMDANAVATIRFM